MVDLMLEADGAQARDVFRDLLALEVRLAHHDVF